MKILLDPVHTNPEPHKCAGNYKMLEIARHLVSTRDDVVVYYLLPSRVAGDDVGWSVDESKLFCHPRVFYHYIPQARDRFREMICPQREWAGAMLFNGSHWDADIIITGRMTLAPQIQIMKGGLKTGVDSFKRFRVLGTENFPMIPNKGSVPYYDQICDTLVYGHLAFDTSYVFIDYYKHIIMERAKALLSPAKLRKLTHSLQHVQPVRFDAPHLKTPAEVKALSRGDLPFTMAYTQRMDVVRRRTEDVFETMKRHWIFNSTDARPVRCVVSSVSKTEGRAKLEFTSDGFDKVQKTRPEYLDMLKNEIHAVIVLSREEGHSFTTIEPLLSGVPVVLWRRPWSESLVGKDYPFFVDGPDVVLEAYAILRRLYANYAAEYEKFSTWLMSHYWPLLQARNETWLGAAVSKEIDSLSESLRSAYATQKVVPSQMTRSLLPLIEQQEGAFSLRDIMAQAFQKKMITYDQAQRMTETAWHASNTGSFSQGLYANRTRHDLLFHYGFRDAGAQGVLEPCGH